MPVKFENASITEQVVVITAGAAGIGRILAEKFLSHGCSVHICDIDRAAIDDFLSDNPGASASVADVANVGEVEAMFDDLVELYGRVDILINNAGIAGPVANLEDISPEDWDRTIAVDLSGQFYVTRLAVPMMKKAGSGSIINISSTAALFGCPMRSPYSASKWAIIGLTKRIERVIESAALQRGKSPAAIREAYQRQTSLRRFIAADEVANMAVFLASDLCGSISGQAMSVDGHTESMSNVMD
jgi:NAD(P)-dependent dehydrogenase (short-subunit alcohol dehydrogenase family)